MSLSNAAILSPCPTKNDLYVVTVGTSATDAVDLFALFGIQSKRSRARICLLYTSPSPRDRG